MTNKIISLNIILITVLFASFLILSFSVSTKVYASNTAGQPCYNDSSCAGCLTCSGGGGGLPDDPSSWSGTCVTGNWNNMCSGSTPVCASDGSCQSSCTSYGQPCNVGPDCCTGFCNEVSGVCGEPQISSTPVPTPRVGDQIACNNLAGTCRYYTNAVERAASCRTLEEGKASCGDYDCCFDSGKSGNCTAAGGYCHGYSTLLGCPNGSLSSITSCSNAQVCCKGPEPAPIVGDQIACNNLAGTCRYFENTAAGQAEKVTSCRTLEGGKASCGDYDCCFDSAKPGNCTAAGGYCEGYSTTLCSHGALSSITSCPGVGPVPQVCCNGPRPGTTNTPTPTGTQCTDSGPELQWCGTGECGTQNCQSTEGCFGITNSCGTTRYECRSDTRCTVPGQPTNTPIPPQPTVPVVTPVPPPPGCSDRTAPPTVQITNASCDSQSCSFTWSSVNDNGCAGGVRYLYKVLAGTNPTGSEVACADSYHGGSCWRGNTADTIARTIITTNANFASACPNGVCTLSVWTKDAAGNLNLTPATKKFTVTMMIPNTPTPATTGTPAAPSNTISTVSCTAADTVTLTLSASPTPKTAPVAGKGNMRILSSPDSAIPNPVNFGPDHCTSTLPVSSSTPTYCTDYRTSVDWKFASLGQKKVWVTFYNDSGSSEAVAYWGSAIGWSKPIAVSVNYAQTCEEAVCNGDANADKLVDGIDYNIWWCRYGDPDNSACPAPVRSDQCGKGDFNSDKKVDGIDYNIWWCHFGSLNTNLCETQ